MISRVNLTKNIAPAFYPVHNAIKRGTHSTFWLKGGRGSTKSSFVAIEIILGIIADPLANALVSRKVGDTIRHSVMETLLWAIGVLGVAEAFTHTNSPAVITYKPTGQKIIMKGLDDPLKLKSIKIKKGYFKFLWFEEAAEFNGMAEIRNVGQSVLRGGKVFVEFITYNPPNDPASWVNKECDAATPGRYVHHSTYQDVPPEWLGPKFIADAEALRIKEPLEYDHEYMGLAVGRAEQIVFHGKWVEQAFETPHHDNIYQSRFFLGADWGFADDPAAFIRAFIMYENGETNLYVDYESGGYHIELDDLGDHMKIIPGATSWHWYGDSSRPETISHVRKSSINIDGAPKWEGSVEDGVEYIRTFNKIIVHPRCVHLIEELKKYSYKVDKHTKEILPIIIDKWNHYIDALRYALADYIKSDVSILDVL